MPQVYAPGGVANCQASAIVGSGVPSNRILAESGQAYIDTATTPPTIYFYGVNGWVANSSSPASETVAGVIEIATTAEAVALTNDTTAITPLKLQEALDGGNATADLVSLGIVSGAATDYAGQATLVAGVATVLNTNIAATDLIMLTRADAGASTALGTLSVTDITASTSFEISALNPADATVQTNDISVVNYVIIRQA